MPPATKLNILIAHPSYGGNGGIDSEHPHIREWAVETILKMRSDPRIGAVHTKTIGDTPVTMVRNRFFTLAKQLGCHLILSVDSDQSPNKHAEEPGFAPFWDAAFNFIYENYGKGPRMVVAPYVGPSENIYVFGWRAPKNDTDEEFSLEQYTRTEAGLMSGIQEVAAGPTGLYLMDTRLLDIIEPSHLSKQQVLEQVKCGEMSVEDGLWALREGYCYYEWKDQRADQKASTEDVTLTRDISLAGLEVLGYNPLYCAWDSWIGHWKPRNLGKPQRFSVEHVGASLRRAVRNNVRANEICIDLDTLNIGDDIIGAMRKAPPAATNGHAKPQIEQKHWKPLRSALQLVKKAAEGKHLIVDVGPGHIPLPIAHEFVGKPDPNANYGDKPFHVLDLDHDRLPYEDGQVDFLYCRHVLEDLANPEHFLSEVRRVAKAGYIETPSPMAEATEGVNAPGANVKGRGYPHHRSACWSNGGGLCVLPKVPAWDQIELPDFTDDLKTPELWNAYHLWEGQLNYYVLANIKDFLLGVDDRYSQVATEAMKVSRGHTLELFDLLKPEDKNTDTGRITHGYWFDHGHAPKEHQAVLADLVRSQGYSKDREIRILEVGTWLGTTAMAMADASTHARVHCVDHWKGTPTDCTGGCAKEAGGADIIHAEFLKRIGDRLDRTIFPWRKSSAEAAAMHWDKFDLIFIDAEHTYEALKADILNWWPHLRDDGIMVGHDFMVHGYDGVGQAVHELFGEDFETVGWHPQGCMWLARKRNHPDLLEKCNGQQACA